MWREEWKVAGMEAWRPFCLSFLGIPLDHALSKQTALLWGAGSQKERGSPSDFTVSFRSKAGALSLFCAGPFGGHLGCFTHPSWSPSEKANIHILLSRMLRLTGHEDQNLSSRIRHSLISDSFRGVPFLCGCGDLTQKKGSGQVEDILEGV